MRKVITVLTTEESGMLSHKEHSRVKAVSSGAQVLLSAETVPQRAFITCRRGTLLFLNYYTIAVKLL